MDAQLVIGCAVGVSRGYIDYNTWMAAMLDWRMLQESEEWNALVEDAFERFQTEGRIGREELRRMLGGGPGGSEVQPCHHYFCHHDDDAATAAPFDAPNSTPCGDGDVDDLMLLCSAQLNDVVAAALREADINQDDFITIEDFRKFMTFSERDRLSLFDNRLATRDQAS